MKKIVIFGTEKLAELARYYIEHDAGYKVEAFTVNGEYIKNNEFEGLPVIPFEEIEKKYPESSFSMFVAIGYKNLNGVRADKCRQIRDKGYELISYINSSATVYDNVKIGDNCFILEKQIIQPFVKISNNVVIWGGCHFGHNTVIGENCWISPHAAICGGVEIGNNSFIGANVTVRDNVKIGKECIIGAGSLILNDVLDKEVYTGKVADLYRLDSEKFRRMMDISR